MSGCLGRRAGSAFAGLKKGAAQADKTFLSTISEQSLPDEIPYSNDEQGFSLNVAH